MLIKETAFLRLFGLQVPLLLWIRPQVVELDDRGCAVRIPLSWRTRNHVGSMYIAVMAAGADLAAAIPAMQAARGRSPALVPIFKDAHMDFLKRADGDVIFRCGEGKKVREAAELAMSSGERVTVPVEVLATVPARYGDDPVARITMGLSMKRKA
jgi:hypothetical protein